MKAHTPEPRLRAGAKPSGLGPTRQLVAIIAFCAALVAGRAVLAAPPCPNAAPRSALPQAVELSQDFAPGDDSQAVQEDFDCFSWASFVALNWPAAADNGVPDTTRPLGQFGANGFVVWETYKQPRDVFLAGGASPCPQCTGNPPSSECLQQCWNQAPEIPQVCAGLELPPETRITELDFFAQAAPNSWLTDQRGNLVRYDLRMNRDEFVYTVTNRLFSKAGQLAFGANLKLPTGSPSNGSAGAIETKSAWRVLTPDDDPERYLSQRTLIVDHKLSPQFGWPDALGGEYPTCNGAGEGPCCIRTMGLVGFHIAHKIVGHTPAGDKLLPQWVWSTFEQVDNAPVQGADGQPVVDPTVTYSFFKQGCVLDGAPCPVNANPREEANLPEPIFVNPVQVVRPALARPATAAAQRVNDQWRQLVAGTFLENYALVSTQWPSAPGTADPATTSGRPVPKLLANSTMETYLPTNSKCIDCHALARTTASPVRRADFSFLYDGSE
jgi:hypothetical protein